MPGFRRFLAVVAVVVAGAAGVGAIVVSAGRPGSPSPESAPPEALARPPDPRAVAATSSRAGVEICELLSLAAQSDPARHYGSGRSLDEVAEVVARQRALLLAAADRLGPGPEADALTVLADAFVGDEADAPAIWTEQQWADALIARAEPALMATIEDIEASC